VPLLSEVTRSDDRIKQLKRGYRDNINSQEVSPTQRKGNSSKMDHESDICWHRNITITMSQIRGKGGQHETMDRGLDFLFDIRRNDDKHT
jgi:hypothetical protein